ncbi:hypothetical protein ciss_10960 [Carboxydothermus islandicus]|uniref:DUF2232 domain-containing protein n=1 Tax=Carboxydothermus islandicus TaxID=661089 RepID=A0A1L8D1Y9_9THEO|nr:YybS family protein [Carboxydothermus islandicus]GAV25163.1 hypothetical protein ciss_10960 [Carboxydothermus islandicus]
MNNTRQLVESAFLAAITAVLVILSVYFPPLAIVVDFVTPIPIAVLVVRHSTKAGILAIGVAAILPLLTMADPISVFTVLFKTGPLGLVYGYFIKRNLKPTLTVAAGMVAGTLGTVITWGITFFLTKINPFAIGRNMEEAGKQVLEFYYKTGLIKPGTEQAKMLADTFAQMPKIAELLFPGAILISSLIFAYLTFILTKKLLSRLGYSYPDLPPFRFWRMPLWLLLVMAVGVLMFSGFPKYPVISRIGFNLMYITGFLFFISGLSITVFAFKNQILPPLWRTFLIVFGILYPPMAMWFILVLGISDTLFDFRKKWESGRVNDESNTTDRS